MRHELETARLRLRPCRAEDVGLLHRLWTEEGVRRFLFDGREISPDEARSFVDASLENFGRHGYGLWLAFARGGGGLVGFAGFLRSEAEAPSLVYGVRPDFWGRGYATEAARAVLDYALESLGVPSVRAEVDEPNAESARVLEKLGMRRTGRALVEGRPLVYFEVYRRPTAANSLPVLGEG